VKFLDDQQGKLKIIFELFLEGKITSMVLKPRVNTVTMKIMIAFWKFFDVLRWLIWI